MFIEYIYCSNCMKDIDRDFYPTHECGDKIKVVLNELKHLNEEFFNTNDSFLNRMKHLFDSIDKRIQEMENDLKDRSFKNAEMLRYLEQCSFERRLKKKARSTVMDELNYKYSLQ